MDHTPRPARRPASADISRGAPRASRSGLYRLPLRAASPDPRKSDSTSLALSVTGQEKTTPRSFTLTAFLSPRRLCRNCSYVVPFKGSATAHPVFPESSDKPRHRGAPKPRAQRGGQRGGPVVRERLPRTLRVLAMTLEMKRQASYRRIRVFSIGSGFPLSREEQDLCLFHHCDTVSQGRGRQR